MRTRSFIGLMLLVAILIVVSTPAILEPTAEGVEHLAVSAGIADDNEAALERERAQDAAQTTVPVEAKLVFKGHVVDPKSGDLRDTATARERASNQRGRLVAGDQRQLMPGQLEDQDAFSRPPVLTEEGMVLDDTGCPVFADGVDPLAVMGDAKLKAQFAARAAKADDPAACTNSINAIVKQSKQRPGPSSASSTVRRADSTTRRSLHGMVIDLEQMTILSQMFDGDALQAQLDAVTS
jgi:hypothetical protein